MLGGVPGFSLELVHPETLTVKISGEAHLWASGTNSPKRILAPFLPSDDVVARFLVRGDKPPQEALANMRAWLESALRAAREAEQPWES
jgi:hypothetical protein